MRCADRDGLPRCRHDGGDDPAGRPWTALGRWVFDPVTVAMLLGIGSAYLAGCVRARRLGRPFPAHRPAAFAAGWVALDARSGLAGRRVRGRVVHGAHAAAPAAHARGPTPARPRCPDHARPRHHAGAGRLAPSRGRCGREARACWATRSSAGACSSGCPSPCTRADSSTSRSPPRDGMPSSTRRGWGRRSSTGGRSSASIRARTPWGTGPACCHSCWRCPRCRSSPWPSTPPMPRCIGRTGPSRRRGVRVRSPTSATRRS